MKYRIQISREAIAKLFMDGVYGIEEGLPRNCKLVMWHYDRFTDSFYAVFENPQDLMTSTDYPGELGEVQEVNPIMHALSITLDTVKRMQEGIDRVGESVRKK